VLERFSTAQIRVVTIEGNPWFVATDICRALDMNLATGSGQWLRLLGGEEKMPIPLNLIHGKGMSQATIISESGLYKLIMRSDKPQARAFQDWVTKEILPSIRKTGAYVTGQASLVENPKMDPLALLLTKPHRHSSFQARRNITWPLSRSIHINSSKTYRHGALAPTKPKGSMTP